MRGFKWLLPVLVFCGSLAPITLLTQPAAAQYAGDAAYAPLAPEDLQQLAGPVALYPDALLAQILVAATYPDDIAAAARYLDGGGDPNAIDDQGWDLSVAGVARYPDLLHYMAANADWMNSLGTAFLNQQADVMNAVQALRGEALSAGNLVSNDQQQIVTDDDGTIEIIPTDPNLIYPPIYDPAVVYQPEVLVVGRPRVPLIRYWNGIRVGAWLHHDLDWHDHSIYVGAWGAERPWWHHGNAPGSRFDYTHDRPGLYSNNHFSVNVHNHAVDIHGGQWNRQMHDPHKPMPRYVPRPANRPIVVRPGSGFARPEEGGGAISNYNHASAIAQERERGRASRAVAQPVRVEPARHEPVHVEPDHHEPAHRPEPSHAEPAHVPQRAAEENHRHALPPASHGGGGPSEHEGHGGPRR